MNMDFLYYISHLPEQPSWQQYQVYNYQNISNQQKQSIFALSVIILGAKLAKADGKTVPLRWNHVQDNEGIIGTAKLMYDQDKMQINSNEILKFILSSSPPAYYTCNSYWNWH